MRVLFGIQEYEDFFSEPNLLQVPLVLWFCEHLENFVLENRELQNRELVESFISPLRDFFFKQPVYFRATDLGDY